MILSFTSSSISPALCISLLSPMAIVIGLWIIIMPTGDIKTSVPAMAITDAAEAARASTFTRTSPLYSISML